MNCSRPVRDRDVKLAMESEKRCRSMHFKLILKSSLFLLPCWQLAILAEAPETPVGILLSASDAKLVRANSTNLVDAKPSDLLFSGDSIRTFSAPASYLFCAGNSRQTLAPKGEALFDATEVRVKKGKLAAQQPAGSCMLPAMLRVSVASQQSYGAMRTRDLDLTAVPVLAHNQLPAEVLADLAPFEKAAAQNSDDPSPVVGMATVFERAGLLANAYEVYGKVQAKWPGVIWVKSKLEELDQLMAAKAKPLKTPAADR
jgi:hypothetical protein